MKFFSTSPTGLSMPQKNVMNVWEMTALYLEYLWEAFPCHPTAEPAGLRSYSTDMPAWSHTPKPKSPGTEHRDRQMEAERAHRRKENGELGGGNPEITPKAITQASCHRESLGAKSQLEAACKYKQAVHAWGSTPATTKPRGFGICWGWVPDKHLSPVPRLPYRRKKTPVDEDVTVYVLEFNLAFCGFVSFFFLIHAT